MREETQSNHNAVRLYNEGDPVDDFPVLKAFQQYIDAEQAKSRRRIITLSVVFGFVTVLLIALFMFIISVLSTKFESKLLAFSDRNQELNDKLVEFAMKERNAPRQDETATTLANNAAMNVMKDTMTALRSQIVEQQKLLGEEQKRSSELIASHAESKAQLDAERSRHKEEIKQQEVKIERIRTLLAAEKDKIEAEREKLRKQAIELHKQRLYPEYYRKKMQNAESKDDILETLDSVEETSPADEPPARAKPTPPPPSKEVELKTPPKKDARAVKKLDDGAFRYFNTTDESPSTGGNSGAAVQPVTKPREPETSDSYWVIPE